MGNKKVGLKNSNKNTNQNNNLCDCLRLRCPGCFFACPQCKSKKCGPTCRVNRKFQYQSNEKEESRMSKGYRDIKYSLSDY